MHLMAFIKYPWLQSTDAAHDFILDGWGKANSFHTKSYAFGE